MTKSKIKFRRFNDILVGVQGEHSLSEEEFDDVIEAYEEAFRANDFRIRMVLVTDSGLTPSQRRRAVETGWSRGTSRAAVVTQSAIVRGVVTALGWIGTPARAVNPAGGYDALTEFLDMTKDELHTLKTVVRSLREEIEGDTVSADLFLRHFTGSNAASGV